jgi:hypothetical protein
LFCSSFPRNDSTYMVLVKFHKLQS